MNLVGVVPIYDYVVLALLVLLVGLVVYGRFERQWVSLAVLTVLLLTGAVSLREAALFIDWDVLGLILGMSFLTAYLDRSGLMDLIAAKLGKHLNTSFKLVFWSSMISGLVSVFLENVTVVLLMAPIVLRLSRKLGVNPLHTLIPVALASNMAGSATMVGDPPAIITAGRFGLAFMDFIWYGGRPSMFFFTIIHMVLACATIAYLTSRLLQAGSTDPSSSAGYSAETPKIDRVFVVEATAFLILKILLLTFRHELGIPLSLAAFAGVGGLTLVRTAHSDLQSVRECLKEGFEWKLLLFLVGVFTLSGAFAKHGLASRVATYLIELSGGNLFLITSTLVWLSVAISAVIDNVPYTVTMLPVIEAVANSLNVEAITIAWAVLLGTTLGGNLTYIGASANVTAVRLLEREGRNVSFTDFIKVSIPFNTVSVVTGWVLYELTWVLGT